MDRLRACESGLNRFGPMRGLPGEANRYEDQSRSDGAIDANCIHTSKATYDGRQFKLRILNPYLSSIKESPTVPGSPGGSTCVVKTTSLCSFGGSAAHFQTSGLADNKSDGLGVGRTAVREEDRRIGRF